jgi:hypothetical protein
MRRGLSERQEHALHFLAFVHENPSEFPRPILIINIMADIVPTFTDRAAVEEALDGLEALGLVCKGEKFSPNGVPKPPPEWAWEVTPLGLQVERSLS